MAENDREKKGTYCITDLIRAGLVFTEVEDLFIAFENFRENYNGKIINIKNNLATDLQNINAIFKIEDPLNEESGFIVELQFLWGERDAISKLNHFYYELERSDSYTAMI